MAAERYTFFQECKGNEIRTRLLLEPARAASGHPPCEIAAGQIQTNRKKIAIVVQNEAGSDEARFVVSEAWPTKYSASELNAQGNEVLIETLELANEGIERVA